MENSIDVNKELQQKNQEMLLNKKRIDLDTAMESLVVFYRNYSTNNISGEINNRVCAMHNIDPNSENGKIYYNTITTFFYLSCEELRKKIDSYITPLKEKIGTITDEEYSNKLKFASQKIINEMDDYYNEKSSLLSNELNNNVNEETKTRINKYLLDVMTLKMINTLRDKFVYSIKVVCNNNEENYQVMQNIKEKIMNKV